MEKPYTDEFATYQSAFLPIADQNNNWQGIFGADLEISEISAKKWEAFTLGLLSSAIISLFLLAGLLAAAARSKVWKKSLAH